MKTWISKAVLAAAIATPAAPAALAQQTPAPQDAAQAAASKSEGQKAVKTYDPAFFARYNPVTAFDMVRQLPGFVLDNGDALRGFGATAGNVLIDGQRPSSKNAISDELARIAARDVARIELIGAAAAGRCRRARLHRTRQRGAEARRADAGLAPPGAATCSCRASTSASVLAARASGSRPT